MSVVDVRLRAIAHEGRRAMLASTLSGERSASQLASVAGLSRPATSQHLSLLLDADLMRVRTEGRRRWYRADEEVLDGLRDELDLFWSPRLDALKQAAES